uniref:Uncharacterized protein n=1 Tax=Rhizophora mucronata TaxID=61149 RepID=A0A2P2PRU7_RHIMU
MNILYQYIFLHTSQGSQVFTVTIFYIVYCDYALWSK